MAYRHFVHAPFLYCWSDGDHVCVQEITGSITRYQCPLRFTTGRQLNPFTGDGAIWCLKHEGVLYVGRRDGTFSGFRMRDGLLVRYGAWDFPMHREFVQVGFFGDYSALLDSADRKTIFIEGNPDAYVLAEPLVSDVDMPPSIRDLANMNTGLSIHVKGGKIDVSKAGTWVSAPELAWDGGTLLL